LSSTGRCTPWSQARGNLFILRKLNYHGTRGTLIFFPFDYCVSLSYHLPKITLYSLVLFPHRFFQRLVLQHGLVLLVSSAIHIKKTKFSWHTRQAHIHSIWLPYVACSHINCTKPHSVVLYCFRAVSFKNQCSNTCQYY
jgi:hypothetical protein